MVTWTMEEDSLPPPEVIFHRYFQDQEHLSRSDRENYYGKQDLDRLEPELRFILTNIQLVFNESLSQAQGATAYVGSPVVPHFDYISAEVANALAFKYQRYSFIGITMPLVDLLLRSSECLSQSGGVRELFNAVAG